MFFSSGVLWPFFHPHHCGVLASFRVLNVTRYLSLLRFGFRANSGGAGKHRGGDGVFREIEFRKNVTVSILSERRVHAPRGLAGGKDGARGQNFLVKADGRYLYLGGKNTVHVKAGERLQILTPGGGGWGSPDS